MNRRSFLGAALAAGGDAAATGADEGTPIGENGAPPPTLRRAVAADDANLFVAALCDAVRACELDGALGRFAAGGQQKNFFQPVWRNFFEQRNQLGAFLAREAVIVNQPTVDLITYRSANRLRAMAGGILVSYINACIAGLFI